MQQNFPFQPAAGSNTTVINVAATSTSTALTAMVGSDGGTVRIVNSGTQPVFIVFGTGAVPATTSSMPLLGNTVENFSITSATTSITTLAAATGSTLYVTVGIGS